MENAQESTRPPGWYWFDGRVDGRFGYTGMVEVEEDGAVTFTGIGVWVHDTECIGHWHGPIDTSAFGDTQ